MILTPCSAEPITEADTSFIIDPGHGGLDGGAISADGVQESGINQAIGDRIYALFRIFGVDALLTRSSEALDYPENQVSIHAKKAWDLKRRAELVNSCPNAVLLSIHQNSFPDLRPNGTQVFYGSEEGSKRLGELLQSNLTACLCPENRRVAAPVSAKNYLLNSVKCPAVLIECGFLSNPQEAAKLADSAYQTALAAVILASCLQYRY